MTNIVVIVGNVGQDPTSRTTQGGAAITTLSVATSRKFKNGTGELVEQTEWHRVTCFNGLGKNVAAYVRKGSKVSVQGRLHYTKWTDTDGVDRYGCEILADTVDFLTKATAAAEPTADELEAQKGRDRGKKPALATGNLDDDVPF